MIDLFKTKTAKWSYYEIADAIVQVYDIKVFETGITDDTLDFDLKSCNCRITYPETHTVETDTMKCIEAVLKAIIAIRRDFEIDDVVAVIHQIRSITFNASHDDLKVITLFD